jgi:hypothetical protein
MIKIEEIIRQMAANAEAIRSLVQTISNEQTLWKPNPETWSMKEVMEHVYNEERGDFRARLKEMFNEPPLALGEMQDGWQPVENFHRALESFLVEREASLAWLTALESPNWDTTIMVSFGPAGDELVLSAGDVLTSWVAHDFLHLRQMNELQYAWNEKQASPYSVQYAGGW